MAQQNSKSHYKNLREKWTKRHRDISEKLWTNHKESLNWITDNTKHLALGSVASLMLLGTPTSLALPSPLSLINETSKTTKDIDKKFFLISDLSNILPKEMRVLTIDEEEKISEVLSRDFGFRVTAELEDKRLNRSYGLIGQEQHLARFPGDNMGIHFDSNEEAIKFSSQGMAPGLGGWGYFASTSGLTNEDKLKEKYYIAVQSFLAPGFNERPRELLNFFKFRKMLVVNPNNGKATVVVIGDAGPSAWTGKHLGGSPEVMQYLEREDGSRKGPVLYFFIDDPKNLVPLGPIEV